MRNSKRRRDEELSQDIRFVALVATTVVVRGNKRERLLLLSSLRPEIIRADRRDRQYGEQAEFNSENHQAMLFHQLAHARLIDGVWVEILKTHHRVGTSGEGEDQADDDEEGEEGVGKKLHKDQPGGHFICRPPRRWMCK